MPRTRFQLWYGRDAAPQETHQLRAGPLTARLTGIDLRHIRVGDVELVQRIYVAVRDDAWNTIPATGINLQLDIADDHFEVDVTARHRHQDLDVSWHGSITGTRDGTISYVMDGLARSDFRYNKIGLNVHHPLRGSIGRPYHAHTLQGTIDGVLPALIEPQRVEHGLLTAMFPAYDALSIDLEGGLTVRFAFDGALFEMQDHRNWTDANYKTYGTPLSIPTPLDARAGQALRQAVRVSVAGVTPSGARTSGDTGEDVVYVTIGRPLGHALPPIGAMAASHGGPLSARETGLLRRLGLAHLRVDLRLADPSYHEALTRAGAQAAALGAALELALLSLPAPLARVLVFADTVGRSATAGSTPASLMRRARAALEPLLAGVPLAGGTNLFFAELNRDRPDVAAMDAVVYSINPQVHACDDTSLIENLTAQAATVRMAGALCGDRPIVVSPITLIGRAGPYAAGPPDPDGLPGNVDVRQASLFGAGWTVGSVASLAASGAAALTYYETTGWLGTVERDDGPPRPDLFPSRPGDVYPLYHVFADLADWKGGEVVELQISGDGAGEPPAVEGLAVHAGGALHALVANTGSVPRTVTLGPLDGASATVRMLDEESAPLAMADPDRFRASGAPHKIDGRTLTLSLPPYAVARIDAGRAPRL